MIKSSFGPLASVIRRCAWAALTAAASAGGLTGVALAEVRIEGRINDMQLVASNATLKEVFDALPEEFRVTYLLPAGIVNRKLSGQYSGTLSQVLARALSGYSYVIEVDEDSTRVVFLGLSAGPTERSSGATVTAQGHRPAPVAVGPSTMVPPLSSYR